VKNLVRITGTWLKYNLYARQKPIHWYEYCNSIVLEYQCTENQSFLIRSVRMLRETQPNYAASQKKHSTTKWSFTVTTTNSLLACPVCSYVVVYCWCII